MSSQEKDKDIEIGLSVKEKILIRQAVGPRDATSVAYRDKE